MSSSICASHASACISANQSSSWRRSAGVSFSISAWISITELMRKGYPETVMLSRTTSITRRVLRLLRGSFWIVRSVDEFLGDGLRIIVVTAGLDGFLIFINGLRAIAFCIIRIAALDARPRIDPRRLVVAAVECGLKIIQRQLPVLLFEIHQPEVVIDPSAVAIELQR